MKRTASCACGQMRVDCEGDPVSVSLCHCTKCQKRTGSVFGIAAFFARGQLSFSGAAHTWSRPSDSGFDVAHHFCPECGSTVWWEPSRKRDYVAVAVGAFADPNFPAPSKQVYEHHRHPWVRLDL